MMNNNDLSDNPWLNISWDNPIAEADRIRIEERYGSVNAFENEFKMFDLELQNALPEPYTGNAESKVYCLGMNPGGKDSLFEMSKSNRDILLEYTQKTLTHEIEDNMWFYIYDHNGYCWWRKITRKLRNELKRDPQMFTIEYFPYHSKNGFKFPTNLPSYSYSNGLIDKARKDHKYILILRHKAQWFKRIKWLESYERLFYIDPKKSRNLVISRDNIIKGMNCKCEIIDLIKSM